MAPRVLASLAGPGTWLRSHALALFGSDASAILEAFEIVERRLGASRLRTLLRGRGADLPWGRSWTTAVDDPHRFWESGAHAAADGRSPLACALLATPRHALLAALQGHPDALRRLAERRDGSLASLSAQRSCEARKGSKLRQAQSSAREWRLDIADALLVAGGNVLARHRDCEGRTALHYAAAAGDLEVVSDLIRLGVEIGAADSTGRAAAHVAASRGHEEVLQKLLAADAQNFRASQRDEFGHTVADLMIAQTAARVGVLELQATGVASSDQLMRQYVATNRPVLVRGGAVHLHDLKSERWADRHRLEAVLGSTPLSAGLIPYGRGDAATRQLSLAEFLRQVPAEGGTAPQPYVFDVAVASRCPELLRGIDLFPRDLCERHLAYVRQPQFGLGFRGAGAHWHSHHAALNALFIGQKQWFLTPPEATTWSRLPAAEWAASEERHALQASGALLEVTQCAGDLLFVPDGWGHATVLQEYSVGVGQEFIPNSSMSR
eukprot:TRINITY_DN16719_c0_g2_i1.p1 TRINITY_DN16719_c0_g2~~TRINITY_DN16719_c0_g2_i1.p1  ORF type:complete len:495 (-),score=94.08 TRINITY_DN16719_c0_g2_i1:361-1845(-)